MEIALLENRLNFTIKINLQLQKMKVKSTNLDKNKRTWRKSIYS